jgi:cyclopropane fatty-acyl-phospholipid synthase-like methyltransferase
MFDLRSVLSIASVYSAFQSAVGGDCRREYLARYVRPEPGMRVLDIGCGPCDFLSYLDPSIDYTGVDLSAAYIESARKKFGARGRFLNESVSDLTVREPASFDRVMANGLIHHLNDSEVRQLLDIAKRALKPDGCFVSVDGCYVEGQSALARYILSKDRGHHVRQRDQYIALAREVFPEMTADVRHDLLRIPYTHVIMVCRAQAASTRAA